jgi:valyl-tRNA synthetase
MLGDTAVAVNPADERYKGLVGKTAILPLVGRELPIVADEAVEMDFGTGAVKVTPAHDPNDFEIAQRHGLPAVNIFDKAAVVNENGGRFAGLGRYEARKAVLEALRAEGVVTAEERPYVHSVAYCDRTPDTEIEPWLSEQWFVAMKELARPAIDVVRNGTIIFIPQQPYTRMYLDWMENIRDWCISRQLWLGHRIPAWYCEDGHITVAVTDPDACATCGSKNVTQDEDTLDTWFSSALWPFSTLGWPDDTDDLRYWYPTSVLSTAREIIYLWVARMIFTGLHFAGDVPFHQVVVHPIVRDAQGRKMSRSLGNVIDPLETLEEYGADALRLALLLGSVGQDMAFSIERVEGARRFINKLWNASRFALQVLDAAPSPLPGALELPERWILSRLTKALREIDEASAAYDFAKAAETLYHFVWSELCDWYLELAKVGSDDRRRAARAVFYHVLEATLRAAHPIMPFVSEEIWQRLPRREGDAPSIMVASWPSADDSLVDEGAEREMSLLQDVVSEIRRFRHDHQIAPRRRIEVVVAEGEAADLVLRYADEVTALAGLSGVRAGVRPDGWSRAIAGGAEIYLPLGELVDVDAERSRLEREIAEADKLADRARTKLANPRFAQGAPADVVEKTRASLAEQEGRLEKLRAQLADL